MKFFVTLDLVMTPLYPSNKSWYCLTMWCLSLVEHNTRTCLSRDRAAKTQMHFWPKTFVYSLLRCKLALVLSP